MAYKLTVANYDRQANFERDLLLFHCSALYSLFQIAISILRATHSRSLAVGCTGAGDLEIAHTWFTQSRDCLRNFGILRMRSTISRLHKFSDCAEQIHLHLICPLCIFLESEEAPRVYGTCLPSLYKYLYINVPSLYK